MAMLGRTSLLILFVLVAQLASSSAYRGPLKFNFLPIQSDKLFGSISRETCNETLANYTTAWEQNEEWEAIAAGCIAHQGCILDNTNEASKAYVASAVLLVGLTPYLLSSVAPTISELGLISLHRPVLSIMLAAGTAAVFPTRVLSYSDDNMVDIVGREPLLPAAIAAALRSKRSLRFVVSVLQYIFVLAAIWNVLATAWEIGKDTIVQFQCQISYLPIIWTLFPVVINFFAIAAVRINIWRSYRRHTKQFSVLKAVKSEVSLSIVQDAIPEDVLKFSTVSAVLLAAAGCLAFVHSIFGILVFSSLLFMSLLDAVVTLFRFCASVVVCRLVIALELQGVRVVQAANQVRKTGDNEDAEREHLTASGDTDYVALKTMPRLEGRDAP